MNYFKIAVLGAAILTVTGCASLLNTQKGPNMLNTEPSGAEVFDANNIKLGNTPMDLKKLPSATRLLKIKLDGYRETELPVRRTAKEGIIFLDAMLLCIPCPFDFSGDNLYNFEPLNPTVRLRKELKERDNSIPLAIDKVFLSSNETYLGKVNAKPVKMGDRQLMRGIGNPEDGDATVKTAFQNSPFEVTYLSSVDRIKSTLMRPKVMIKPIIKKVDFDLKGKSYYKYSGTQSITVDWNVYNLADKNKAIASFTTNSSVFRLGGTSASVFDQLLYEATLDLLEIDTLYDYLRNAETEYMASTKGEAISIDVKRNSKYASSKEALKEIKTAVITVLSKDGFGSGSIISPDGYVLTNFHVISDEKNITVRLHNDVKMKASLVKTNKDYDLALLKIEAENLKSIPIGNSGDAGVGDEVYAIGTPLDEALGQTITRGIISGERTLNGIKFLQTDVSINEGNSGGPLVNEKGEMIGITTMKLKGSGIEGLGFCIPSNTVFEMLNINE